MGKNIFFFITVLIIIPIFAGCSEEKKYITKFDDLKEGVSIGAMTGSTGEALAKKNFPETEVKSFDDIMDAVAALKSNQLDAVISGFPQAFNVSKYNSDITYLAQPADTENTAIAVRKGNPKLLSDLNNFIEELLADGTLKDMKRRWFKDDFLPYEKVDIKPPDEGEVLKVGTSATREPFCFVNEDGEVTGHDGELARRIGAKLGRPIEFVDMKFAALIPALASGKIDIIVTGMTATPERAKSVDFTKSYFLNAQMIIVKKPVEENAEVKDEGLKLRTLQDLKTKKIGVLTGSTHDSFIQHNYPDATAMQYKSPPELLLAVRSGKVDAAVYTTETLNEILRAEKDMIIFGDTLFAVPVAMGFNRQDDELREKFNEFFTMIKANGVYADMKDRWMNKGVDEMPEIKSSGTNGTFTVGIVSDKGLPFTIVKDNKVIGFDIELPARFAAYLGKELKLADMDFGSLIAAAASRKIDMISSTLMITKERAKQIDYSDSYMSLGASMVVLKKNVEGFEVNETAQAASSEKSFFEEIAESFYSNIILENRYVLILDGLKTTAVISILATIFGTILGGLICFMRMSKNKILLHSAKVYISVLRGTPVLVLLMIIFYVVFASVNIDPVFVAVFAFGLNFAAYVSEMYRTGIESIDNGQTEAGIAMGFTKVKTFIYIILPQAARRILPVYKGEMISLVKMTSIVGYIAVQDLTKASDIIRSRTFDAFFPLIMVAVLYFIISWLLMLLLGYIEKKTNPKLSLRRG